MEAESSCGGEQDKHLYLRTKLLKVLNHVTMRTAHSPASEQGNHGPAEIASKISVAPIWASNSLRKIKNMDETVSLKLNGNYFISGNHLMAYSKSEASLDKDWNNNIRLQLSLKLSFFFFLITKHKDSDIQS